MLLMVNDTLRMRGASRTDSSVQAHPTGADKPSRLLHETCIRYG